MESPRRIEWRVAIAGAVALTLLFSLQQSSGLQGRREVGFATALALQMIVWGLWLALLPLVLRVARLHPLEARPTPAWVARSVIAGLTFVLVHSVLAGVARWTLGLAIAPTLAGAITNGVSAGFASNILRYSAILAVWHAVVYHDTVRERDQRAARLELDLARAKLANVEACLRPHFLFNTLNAIAALVRDDPAAAERTVGDLSELLRASLNADPSREVRLDDELELTAKYLDLERVRFQDRLHVVVRASDEARRAMVPQLLLQPIVENAVRHGLAPLEAGGSIVVTAARRDATLHVSVQDDGVGMRQPSPAAGAGIGLGGLRTRLAHLYGDRHRIACLPVAPRGTLVEIEIPYRSAAA
jgi:two-component system, LytTR family, sensor kinase